MKYFAILFILGAFVLTHPSTAAAQDSEELVKKETCISSIGYNSTSDLKDMLEFEAKQLASSELFGEFIASYEEVNGYSLSKDQIQTSTAGFIRLAGSPQFYNHGNNFAEVCISIEAFATDDDRQKLEPVELTNKLCESGDGLTTQEVQKVAKDKAILGALLNYENGLDEIDEAEVIRLLKDINYLESEFDSRTGAFCVSIVGQILPIEVITMLNKSDDAADMSESEESTEGGEASDSDAVESSDSTPLDDASLTYEQGSTTFEIVEVTQINGEIELTIKAVNRGNSYSSYLCRSSDCRLFDTDGTRLVDKSVTVGTSTRNSYILARFPKQAPYRFTVTFESGPDVSLASLIEVDVGDNILTFYNVPIPYKAESGTTLPNPVGETNLTYEQGSTEFEIVEVTQINGVIELTIKAVNRGSSYNSYICRSSDCRLFDTDGTRLVDKSVTVGTSTRNSYILSSFPKLAPYRFTVTFESGQDISLASLVEVDVGDNILTFYNVPVPYKAESGATLPNPVDETILTYEQDSTDFEIVKVTQLNGAIEVTVRATNLGESYNAYICRSSDCRLFDTDGIRFIDKSVTVGTNTRNGYILASFPKQAPYQFTVAFESVPDLSSVSLVEVSVGSNVLTFYNVPVPYDTDVMGTYQ